MGRVTNGIKRLKNIFSANEENANKNIQYGMSSTYSARPHQNRIRVANERSILNSVLARLAVDVASTEIKHVRLDKRGRYVEDVKSLLNECLTVEPNLDQGPRAFLQDIAMTMFKHGVAAVVPIEGIDDSLGISYDDIEQLRVGTITQWMPRHVRVSLYDDRPAYGYHREIVVEKRRCAIVENPFYDVMNEQNSTLQRLIYKLGLLDKLDQDATSNRLDLIVQLPYVIRGEARQAQAERRRDEIELQLKGSQYGIAYTDGSEKITQLNRPVENNLFTQIPYLQDQLLSELGMTNEIRNGTASESTMLNYNSRTIEPVLDAIAEEFLRKFLTKAKRSRGHAFMYFRNPFKLIPLSALADVADVLSRNEIVTPNELRAPFGLPPSDDPKADELRNSNMPTEGEVASVAPDNGEEASNALEELETAMTDIMDEFGIEEDEVEDE